MTGLRIVAAIVVALCQNVAEGNVGVTSNPQTIQPGKPLTVNCNFNYDSGPNSNMDTLVSLTLSRKATKTANQEDLISITSFHPNAVTSGPTFSGTSSGEIKPRGQTSFLEAEFSAPTDADAGEYECNAQGVDSFGRQVSQSGTVTVNSQNGGSSNLQAQVSSLQNQLSSCTANLLADTAKLDRATGLAKKLAENAPLSDVDIIGTSDVFDGKAVYLVTRPNLSYAQARAACARHGGYVVEIDNEEEFQFVSNLLKDPNVNLPSNVNSFITGAYYTNPQQPFVFATNTQNPVYTGHWYQGEPDLTGPPNTWLLIYNLKGQIGFADGPNSADPNRSFVCEIEK